MLKFLNMLSKRNDVVLAFLLICIVFMMILPLPTIVVDVLIAVNLCLSAILLMVAVYISDVVRFSAFPSILLLTTLFRLALSITTTRLILLQADAGEIVDTFGNFVVSGNLVVGAVIFLILTIVNFLVITKGSERVAEVSARFSLDSMPGKQMSIDAAVRSGSITEEEGQDRRDELGRLSSLFGNMDGAMKFVWGDAIGGGNMTAINIVAGIGIGVMQRGMGAGDAAQTYTLLTMGDGLVSQIPALLISTAAGIIVTRAASDTDFGTEIKGQIGRAHV